MMSNTATGTGAFIAVEDESLLNGFPPNAALILVAGAKELTWTVFDNDKNKFLSIQSFHYAHHSDIEEIVPFLSSHLSKEKIFKNRFRAVTVVVDSPLYTLLPDTLYESSRREEYMQFNHEVPKGDIVDAFSMRSRGIVALFSYPASLRQSISKVFPSAKVIPSVAGLSEASFNLFRNKEGKNILVNVKQQSFDVVVIDGNKLVYMNSFPFRTSEDFLYYLLFACEQLQLNTETMELHVAGEIEKRSGLGKLIEKYVRNVSYVKRPDNFEYSYKFGEVPVHYFYNVFSQQLCV